MSNNQHLEVEVKFAVAAETAAPELSGILGVGGAEQTQIHKLSAIYFDTKDLRLTRAKMTLRRRTGGKDSGWHLKMPADSGRLELQAPYSEGLPPEDLLAQVRAIVRDAELVAIAQVDNERHETVLLDEVGAPIAEFCDDHVTAWSFLPGGEQSSWREWELELVDNPEREAQIGTDVLASATQVFIAAGARKSASPSKLAMALGDSVANAEPGFALADLDPDDPAYAVIHALGRNRDKLIEYDARVRRDEWDSVHQMRVATRELRSHMQTFEGILGGAEYLELEKQLKVLAGILGVARDAEVVEERFLMLLDAEDTGVLDEQTKEHLRTDMGEEYKAAHRRIIHALDSTEYLRMLDSLDRILANPPRAEIEPEAAAAATEETETAEDTAEEAEAPTAEPATPMEILIEHLEGAYAKLEARHNKALAGWEDPELTLHQREERFHDMRKSAKKLRYAAEAVGDATELDTNDLYKACKIMQEVLGDFQDSVTSRDKLLKKARQARSRGEDTFGYGVVYQLEHQIGLESLLDYARAFNKIETSYRKLNKKAEKAIKKARKKEEEAAKKE